MRGSALPGYGANLRATGKKLRKWSCKSSFVDELYKLESRSPEIPKSQSVPKSQSPAGPAGADVASASPAGGPISVWLYPFCFGLKAQGLRA